MGLEDTPAAQCRAIPAVRLAQGGTFNDPRCQRPLRLKFFENKFDFAAFVTIVSNDMTVTLKGMTT
jgi:hypothetical protein